MRFLFAVIFSLTTLAAGADDDELRQTIVGTWKLVSVVYEETEG